MDWCTICCNVESVLVCCGEESVNPKGEALSLPVIYILTFTYEVWVVTQKHEMTDTSD